MNAFSYPSKRGINFAKIRGFKVTDYRVPAKRRPCAAGQAGVAGAALARRRQGPKRGWQGQKGGSSTKMADLVDGGRQETETGKGQLNKKEADSFESASMRGGSRIRTGDPMLAKHVLYQLSYTPKRKKPVWWAGLVGTGRVELPTSTLSVWRSNQLS